MGGLDDLDEETVKEIMEAIRKGVREGIKEELGDIEDEELDIETIKYILDNEDDETIEELLTPDDCLRFMASASGIPLDTIRERFRNVQEGLPVDD